MNWDDIEGKWVHARGKIRERWGKVTNDDLDVIAGKRDQLLGVLQQRYGMAREELEKQVDEFTSRYPAVR